MAVILTVERKTAKARLFLALVYAVLSLGGVTMVWPFLVMLASSLTGPYDYYRFSPVVRALWDREDRFRALCGVVLSPVSSRGLSRRSRALGKLAHDLP